MLSPAGPAPWNGYSTGRAPWNGYSTGPEAAEVGEPPWRVSMDRKRLTLSAVALLILAALALGAPAWARPGQHPNFQTVPTPTPPTKPSPTIPPQPTQPPLPTEPPQPTRPPAPTQPPQPSATLGSTPTSVPATATTVPAPHASPTETVAATRVATQMPGSTAAPPTPSPTVPKHPSAGPNGGGISYRWRDSSRVVVSAPSGCMKDTLWLSVQPLAMPDAPARVGGDWLYPSRLGMVLDAWHAATGKPFPRSDTLPCSWKIRLTPSRSVTAPVDGDPARLRLAWYDESAGRWVPLDTKASGGAVVAETKHTGAFGLMLVPPPGPPETLPDTGADRGWIVALATAVVALLAMAGGAIVSRRRAR